MTTAHGLKRACFRAAGGLTVTFHASAVSEAQTVTWPGSLQAGDLAVLIDNAINSSGTPTAVTPSGFTIVVNATPTGFARFMVTRKILVGSESGSLTGMNGNTDNAKVLFVFRPSATISSVISSTWSTVGPTTSDPSAQTVSASGVETPVIVFGFAGDATSAYAAAFSGNSPALDAEVATSGSPKGMGGYKIYNSSPADHTIDMADLGSLNTLASGYLRLT